MIATAFNKPGPLKDANTESVQTSKAIFESHTTTEDHISVEGSTAYTDASADARKTIVISISGSSINWNATDNITMPELIGALDITKSQIIRDMFPDTLQKLIQRN